MSRHARIFQNAARRISGANGTWRAGSIRLSMRARAATKAVTLHDTLEAFALGGTNHINQLTNFEHRGIELLTDLKRIAGKWPHFAQHLEWAKSAAWALSLGVALRGTRLRSRCCWLCLSLAARLSLFCLSLQVNLFACSSLSLFSGLLFSLFFLSLLRLLLFCLGLFALCLRLGSFRPCLGARLCLSLLLLAALRRKLRQRMA